MHRHRLADSLLSNGALCLRYKEEILFRPENQARPGLSVGRFNGDDGQGHVEQGNSILCFDGTLMSPHPHHFLSVQMRYFTNLPICNWILWNRFSRKKRFWESEGYVYSLEGGEHVHQSTPCGKELLSSNSQNALSLTTWVHRKDETDTNGSFLWFNLHFWLGLSLFQWCKMRARKERLQRWNESFSRNTTVRISSPGFVEKPCSCRSIRKIRKTMWTWTLWR